MKTVRIICYACMRFSLAFLFTMPTFTYTFIHAIRTLRIRVHVRAQIYTQHVYIYILHETTRVGALSIMATVNLNSKFAPTRVCGTNSSSIDRLLLQNVASVQRACLDFEMRSFDYFRMCFLCVQMYGKVVSDFWGACNGLMNFGIRFFFKSELIGAFLHCSLIFFIIFVIRDQEMDIILCKLIKNCFNQNCL